MGEIGGSGKDRKLVEYEDVFKVIDDSRLQRFVVPRRFAFRQVTVPILLEGISKYEGGD